MNPNSSHPTVYNLPLFYYIELVNVQINFVLLSWKEA